MMSTIFGDDGVDDLLNDNLIENPELPSDDDDDKLKNQANGGDNLFADDGEEGAAADGVENGIKVEPKKRSVRNPRPRLTVETLRGPRGIQTIEDYIKDIKFEGKGHEKQDLDEVMRRLQHWGHRMYPTYKFDDVLANIERLGKKKPLQVHMSRYRLGMLEHLKLAEEQGLENDDDGPGEAADEPFDEFDALLGEQIAISKLAPRTPAFGVGSTHRNSLSASTTNMSMASSTFVTPSFGRANAFMSTPYSGVHNLDDTSDLATPLPPSQPSTPVPPSKKLSAEQLAKIAENRRLAQERLHAKQLQKQQTAESG